MNPATQPSPSARISSAEKALTLALRLAHAESALLALTSGQVDAIVDPSGHTYLLRPAQEQLRLSEKRLQAVIDSVADAITVVNRGGIIVSQSQAARRVLGCEPEEMVGSSLFAWIHEEDLAETYSAFFNVIEEFRSAATLSFRHLARDGSTRRIEATVAKLSDVSAECVIFSQRPISNLRRQPHELLWPSASDMAPSGEERECIILSHGRRIPLTEVRISSVFTDAPPE